MEFKAQKESLPLSFIQSLCPLKKYWIIYLWSNEADLIHLQGAWKG